MALHLVTGYKGTAHITSADQGSFNAGTIGAGDYVLGTGKKFEAQVVSNNIIRIYDGDLLMQGRHVNLKNGSYEEIAIANGLQTMNRNDLIVARYAKDTSSGIESVTFAVLQGVSTEGTASDPVHTTGDILAGDTLHEMPLYRVKLTALNVSAVEPLFSTVPSIANLPNDALKPEDVVDNLLSNSATLPLSAKQGKVLDEKISEQNKKLDNIGTYYDDETDTLYIQGGTSNYTYDSVTGILYLG